MTTRRDFLRGAAIAASGLVCAESVRDWMEWQNRRVFALGAVRRAGAYEAHMQRVFESRMQELKREVARQLHGRESRHYLTGAPWVTAEQIATVTRDVHWRAGRRYLTTQEAS